MTERNAITREYLISILDYDPETGIFRWKLRPVRPEFSRTDRTWNSAWAGKEAGRVNRQNGYRYIVVNYAGCLAHRLAFLYMTGAIPKVVDHINAVRDDNRWPNLRAATTSQNLMNSKRRKNISGYRGVYWSEFTQSWMASIQKNRKAYYLGRFKDKDQAPAAYEAAAEKLFGNFRRPQIIGTEPETEPRTEQ